MQRHIRWWLFIFTYGIAQVVFAEVLIDRRRDQYPPNFGYFVYPIATEIPGLGAAKGGGATFVNVANTDTDLTGFYIDGDFHAAGFTALNTHLIPRHLIFDVGLYEYQVAFKQFDRGLDSSKDKFIYPEVEGHGGTAQLTLTFFDKRLDFYSRFTQQSNRVIQIHDSTGENNYLPQDGGEKATQQLLTVGVNIDLTDDRQDPRRGFRIEANRKELVSDVDPIFSSFRVYDTNLTAYIPVGRKDTWVWNLFGSRTKLIRQGSTDYAELQGRFGLSCGAIADPAARAGCEGAESQYINSILDNNRYGTSNPLGGTQRLRSYPGGRFHAGETLFIGTEYRWNLTEEYTPVNWFFLKGRRTNMQLSFFAEAGSVADRSVDLTRKMKYSYGVGFRMLFEGTTLRADVAQGDEGTEMILFIDYPFSLYSVDSPG